MEVLHRDDLPQGGFAGLLEHRLVKDSKVFGNQPKDSTWNGIGNFVYLADARFLPNGETKMHPHKEIDVISVMVKGRIKHEGSLEHGQSLDTFDAQVQRAGGQGFTHNEINPDSIENRMIQLWVTPEIAGQCADYQVYQPAKGDVTRIYGGDATAKFPASTFIDIGLFKKGQQFHHEGEFLAYITTGLGTANGISVTDGDLLRDSKLSFEASEDCQLILIHI
ncbi:pirin family protein [Pseudomonas sp. HK3]|jgi:redox-sensitive bicupin YhaK (pirin superfamily)